MKIFLYKLFIDFYNMLHKNGTVFGFLLSLVGLKSPFGGFAASRISTFSGGLDRSAGSSGSVGLEV